MEAAAIERSGGDEFVLIDEEPTLVLDLTQRLGWQDGTSVARAPARATRAAAAGVGASGVPLLLAEVRSERVALRVVRLSGQQDVYVKPPPALLAGVRSLIGLTVLGDGRPVFLVDLNQLR